METITLFIPLLFGQFKIPKSKNFQCCRFTSQIHHKIRRNPHCQFALARQEIGTIMVDVQFETVETPILTKGTQLKMTAFIRACCVQQNVCKIFYLNVIIFYMDLCL